MFILYARSSRRQRIVSCIGDSSNQRSAIRTGKPEKQKRLVKTCRMIFAIVCDPADRFVTESVFALCCDPQRTRTTDRLPIGIAILNPQPSIDCGHSKICDPAWRNVTTLPPHAPEIRAYAGVGDMKTRTGAQPGLNGETNLTKVKNWENAINFQPLKKKKSNHFFHPKNKSDSENKP